MAFLLEMMVATESTMPSPFIECIIFSTILGRELSHQQESVIECVYANVMTNNRERQSWLYDTHSRQTVRLQQNYSSAAIRINSMLLFTSMLAQATILLQCKTTEPVPQVSAEKHSQYQERAVAAAKEIVRLCKILPQFSFFKVSLLMNEISIILHPRFSADVLRFIHLRQYRFLYVNNPSRP